MCRVDCTYSELKQADLNTKHTYIVHSHGKFSNGDSRVLFAQLPGASKSQIRASILNDQEITVARIGQAKSV